MIGLFASIPLIHCLLSHRVHIPKRFNPLIISSIVLIFYVVARDLAAVMAGSASELASIRFAAALGLSVLPAYFLSNLAGGDQRFLKRVLLLVLVIQSTFFIFMFAYPESKPVIYNFFAMGDSVNLYEWNMFSRGFGVSSEINFLAPLATVFIGVLVLSSLKSRLAILAMQVLNTNFALFGALLLVSGAKVTRVMAFVTISLLVLILFYKSVAGYLELVAPRLYAEAASGFSRTASALISDHLHILTDGTLEALFGTGAIIASVDNIFHLRSDSGWIILYNYGGIAMLALFMFFTITLILPFKDMMKPLKLPLFLVLFLANTKGFLLGPNAMIFLISLLHFSAFGEARRAKNNAVSLDN